MSMENLNRYQAALEKPINAADSWKDIKRREGIKGEDLASAMEVFAKNYSEKPTMEHFEKAHSFSQHLERVASGIDERVAELGDMMKATGFMARVRSSSRESLQTQKMNQAAVLREAKKNLDEGLRKLNPTNWCIADLPAAQIVGIDHELKDQDLSQTDRDFSGRGSYHLWDENTGKWNELPQDAATVKATLNALLGEDADSSKVEYAMAAATQTSLNSLTTNDALLSKGKTLTGVEYRSYFYVNQATKEVKMRMEASAKLVDFGQRDGEEVTAHALYDSQVALNVVHVRV